MCFAPQRRCNFLTSNLQQVVRTRQFFHILTYKYAFAPQPRAIFEHRNFQNGSDNVVFCATVTCKCASRHSRVPFLNIGTSKIGPRVWCFAHYDLQMCFAPQRRAIFHLFARTATSAPAALARLLFEHQEPRIIEKTQRFATSLTFFTRVPSFK